MKLIFTVVFLLFAGYVLLAYGMDISYDAGTNQSSFSIEEARERKTLIAQLNLDRKGFSVGVNGGIIREIWIEKNWGYQPHGLADRILNVHPTAIRPGSELVVKFEGDSLIKSHLIKWEFCLKSSGGEGFGGGRQTLPLDDRAPMPGKLYVRERLEPYDSQSAITDSVTLRP